MSGQPSGLDHRTERPAGQGAGPGRGPGADPVRSDRPDRDHLSGVHRLAAGRLMEPFLRGRASPNSKDRSRHRGGPGQDRRRLLAGSRSATRQGQDRRPGRQGMSRARSPRSSPSRSPTTASPTPATRTPSTPRPPSTASTCCAPASRLVTWKTARSSPPARPWPRSSGPSAPSIPTWTSARSGTAPKTGSGRTCSCGCCRTTSPGTCRPASRPCCSPTTTSPPPGPHRTSPVAPAARSPRALAKAATKQTPGDLPVHSFATLLADLATICLNPDPARRSRPARLPARHHPDPAPAAGLRTARRQPPSRGRVVSTPPRIARKPR